MWECTACPRRLIGSVFADIANTRPLPQQISCYQSHSRRTLRFRRGYATEAIPYDATPTSSPSLDLGVRNPYLPRHGQSTNQNERFNRTSLEQEVRWLRDPLKLGDHVVRLLRQDDHEKALALVRLAGRDLQCTVSWNYLIDYSMSKGKVADAVKLYNEMKKRAQLPDAHTFTTLFRGFSWHYKFPLSVSRTLSIYHSMFAENSPVRPSVIHTNAALKVCALAGDMDALLGIAAKLPPRGNGAPNKLTFTTILNAIRSEAWKSTKGEKAEPTEREERMRAVMQGRRLWEEIRDRWVEGDLRLDEELVCAMGRLMLLADDEQNNDDILSLIEQTMGVPRQIPRRGEPGRRGVFRNPQAIDIPAGADLPSLDEMAPVLGENVSDPEVSSNLENDAFAVLPNVSSETHPTVRPGQNTLSLVLEACIRIHLVRAAQNYWGLLTDPSGPYKIVPDTENYHMYLRLLRVQRASKLALELIDDMHQGARGSRNTLQTKTFRIGLSCCLRDKNNKNSLGHAATLVRLMNDTLEYPDARALCMYLKLGLVQEPRDWRTLMSILRGTELSIRNLRSLRAYDPEIGNQLAEDIKELVKLSIGMIDVVLDIGSEEITDTERQSCKEQKYALQAWVTKMVNRDKAILKQRKGKEPSARENMNDASNEDLEAGESKFEDRDKESRWQRKRRKKTEKNVAASWQRLAADD